MGGQQYFPRALLQNSDIAIDLSLEDLVNVHAA